MILLRLISWSYFRKHVLRTLLTTLGIVLGVGVFVGMHTANQSVLAAFAQTVDRIAGKTELQVSAGGTGFGEDILDQVQSASTVRVAVPVIEAIVESNIPGEGDLLILGIDMTGDRSLRDYDLDSGDAVIDDPLIFLAQPDSLMISREFADRHGITIGHRLPLGTIGGERQFVVRGIVKSSGLASAFGGNLAIMDIYAAQKMFGRGRTFDRIDLATKPGTTLAECERELTALLGAGFEIQAPATRGRQLEAVLAGYSTMVSVSSVFALLIGMFIIYNSFSIAVAQRRSEIGILRALGATQRQVRWLFLGESAVMGTIGSLGGVALGLLIAREIAGPVSSVVADVYFISQQVDAPQADPMVMTAAFALGLMTSLIAALIPARNAARVDPVQALQKGRYQVLSAGENRRRILAAAILGAGSLFCLASRESRPLFYLGYVLAVVAVPVLLGPLLSVWLAKALRPVLRWLRPVEGVLAADALINAPRRTSASVMALALSIALVIGFSGMALSLYDSIVTWMNTTYSADLFVSPTSGFDMQTTRFPATMASELAAIPGVQRVQMFRTARITFRKTPVTLLALEMASVAETNRREPVAGDADEMYRRSAAGEGIVVSDNLAELQNLRLGEIVEIPAPYGLIRLPIVGIIIDYSDQQGTIVLDRSLFLKYWRDDSVRNFPVFVAPGTEVSAVRQRVLERFAGERQVFVLTNEELRQYILRLTNQWFGLTWIQIAIAVLVAILGIVNTLTVSIMDRRRELGVLQAVGALHSQIQRTIWIEALSIGVLGLLVGFAVGAINLYYVLEIIHRDIAGLRLLYRYPVTTVLALVPMMLLTAFVAALWPARSAVRGSLVEALEYE